MNRKRPSGRFSADEKARNAFLHEIGECCVNGCEGIEVAHISGTDYLFNKPVAGMGDKAHWVWTLPLSPMMHRQQHEMGEEPFWKSVGWVWRDITRGPMATALVLEGFRSLQDVEGARRWLRARRGGF